MKILYCFADKGTYMTQWQYEHIIDELQHHGISIEIFNPLIYPTFDEANERLLNTLRAHSNYDLFMTCCSSKQIYRSTILSIKKLSIPTLLICFDNLHAAYIHKEIMPCFDLVWLTSWENETVIRKYGVNTIFMPYAANPYKFTPSNSLDIKKVCFIGTPYGTRSLKINQLTRSNIPTDVFYGKPADTTNVVKKNSNILKDIDWDALINSFATDVGRKMLLSRFVAIIKKQQLDESSSFYTRKFSLPFDEMTQAYSNYALDLNVLELRNTYLLPNPVYKLHLRTFEIPMCGGIQFTSYSDELSKYFEEGKEIVFYKDENEYFDKAHFYLRENNQTLRDAIRKAARQRAESEHTWWLRFEKIFQTLNLKY